MIANLVHAGPGRATAGRRARCRPQLPAFLMVVAMLAALLAAPAEARDVPGSFADLAARLSPAVVNISTTQRVSSEGVQPEFKVPPGSPFEEFFKEFFDKNRQPQPRRVTSLGSGFVIDSDGLVVTNNHVIAEAD
ncbi:MAG TPA: serine protease, partial [Alphaproteobacteria bacterium]|nr:serine protease [Alphaproteobacteria bacterium]